MINMDTIIQQHYIYKHNYIICSFHLEILMWLAKLLTRYFEIETWLVNEEAHCHSTRFMQNIKYFGQRFHSPIKLQKIAFNS
jgi:hypothetical protein